MRPRAIGTLLLACAAFAAALPGAAALLEWDRALVARGELWRVLTGHLTHFTVDHLLWDAAVFLALGAACEIRAPRRFALSVAASALAIPIAISAMAPGIRTYRGLSGIDSALFALYATLLLRDARMERRKGAVAVILALGIAFLGKILFELRSGAALFVASTAAQSRMVPVPLAHVIGAAMGVASAVVPIERRRRRCGRERSEPLEWMPHARHLEAEEARGWLAEAQRGRGRKAEAALSSKGSFERRDCREQRKSSRAME